MTTNDNERQRAAWAVFIRHLVYTAGVVRGAPQAWRIAAHRDGWLHATAWALRVLRTRVLMLIGARRWQEI